MRKFRVLLEWDETDAVFVSYVPTLNFLSTFGATREEAIENTREAILGYLDTADKEGIAVEEESGESELLELAV